MLRLFKKTLAANTRGGVTLDDSWVGMARVKRLKDGELSLAACAFGLAEKGGNWSDRISSCIGTDTAQPTAVSTVLRPDAYRLQYVETPNVPADEMLAAVRWRIKDMIDYPLDEAVIELFEMPLHSRAGSKPSAYAVVSQRSEILDQIERMDNAGLSMDVIDIPELCMRNIAMLLPQDKDGVALLYLAENCGYLTITRKGLLHLVRRIETGRHLLAEAADDEFLLQERVAGISLEVQRSLDYFESNYDFQPIAELVICRGAGVEELPAALAEHLGLVVSQIQLGDLFHLENEISSEAEGHCLLAIGAALRVDEAAAGVPSV